MEKKPKKKTHLVIDGNLLARKCFYKFKNLSANISIANLEPLAQSLAANEKKKHIYKVDAKEFISEESGKTLSIDNNGKIDIRIQEMSLNEHVIDIPTGILYGMLRSILVANKKCNINGQTIICYDPVFSITSETQPFRKEYYPEYKSRKKDAAEEIIFLQGLTLAQSFFYKIGITQTKTDSFEADDLLHYYSHKKFKDDNVIVMTNDHDMFQLLVPNRVKMLRIGMDPELFSATEFKNKYGIKPTQWGSVQALGGCSTDNVKGVYGISSETAIKLIGEFKTIKSLLNSNWGDLPKRIVTALEKEKAQNYRNIKLSRKLTKLYGLDEFLNSSKDVAKNNKAAKILYENALIFIKALKFNSFTSKVAKYDLKELIAKNQ